MKVTVVWATRDVQDLVALDLEPGATVADAIARSGLAAHYGFDAARMIVAVYGRRMPPDALLAEGDRLEITRPLTADPKEARRRRSKIKNNSSARTARTRLPEKGRL
jgi:uncharacterized protein